MRKLMAMGMAAALAVGSVAAESPDSMRLVTYNIHHGESRQKGLDLTRPARLIARLGARFVCLQEVDQGTQRVNGADTCAVFARTCGLHATFAKAINYDGGEYGVAVLSREKPLKVRRTPLPGQEPRVLLLCEFDDCWVGTMHLDVNSVTARVASVEIVRREVVACGGKKPVFLSGDWNAAPGATPICGLKQFLTVLSPQNFSTFSKFEKAPGVFHDRCIDYLTVDTAHAGLWRVKQTEVIPDVVTSDHLPVTVEIERRYSSAPGCARPLKVLMIGNSFSICVLKQMPQIAQAMGLKLDLCSLYIGGRSFAQHWENVKKGEDASYAPYEVGWNFGGKPNASDASVAKVVRPGNPKKLTAGPTRGGGFANIPQILKADCWDVVTIQQASHASWRPETYHPEADNLVKTIRALAPQAEIVVQETWSYTPFDRRLAGWKLTPERMYEKLHAAYADFAATYGFRVIPMGTAVQRYRRALPVVCRPDALMGDPCGKLKFAKNEKGDWTTSGDAFHLNREGEYLQGLVWTAKLFGADVTKCPYRPKFLRADRAEVMRRVAMEVVAGSAR